MSDSVRPHRRQPTRLPCPWDSPGKNTGVGCHFLLQQMYLKDLITSFQDTAGNTQEKYSKADRLHVSSDTSPRGLHDTECPLPLGSVSDKPSFQQPSPGLLAFPGGSAGKESTCNAGDLPGFNPWVGKIPWRREWLPTPVFWPGEFHGL